MSAALPFTLVAPATPAEWRASHKGGVALLRLADAHYTRQKPGSAQCCRPGKNFVLVLSDGSAGWVVWRPLPEVGRMDGLECWECTLFRNEGERLSSELIREATDLTYREWGWPPRDGLITAVGIKATSARRSKKSPPGRCFIEAGWEPMDKASDGKAWLRAPGPRRIPRPAPASRSASPGDEGKEMSRDER